MKIFIPLVLTLISFFTVQGQSTFLPQSFGTGVNSPYDEVNPVISSDKKTLLFARKNHPQNGFGEKKTTDIWISTLQDNGTWSEAQRSTSLNVVQHNIPLTLFNNDANLLLYNDQGLAIATRQGDAWSAPQKLGLKGTAEATITADGAVLFYSKGGKLYVSVKGGGGDWIKAQPVKGIEGKVNTPFIVGNGKTLYFSRTIKGKKTDLFKTTLTGNDWQAWSAPVSLSDTINTLQTETTLTTNPNGAWGYFAAAYSHTGKTDIYRVKLYEDHPYVLVSGKVINAKTKRALVNKDIKFLINGQETESVVFNKDSASYSIKLPFGKSYTLTAQLFQYGSLAATIDATADKEFRKVSVDLEEEPVPFVLVKGKLMIKNTDRAIPAAAQAKIMIDGEETDSASVDTEKGTYSIKLNHGSVYYIQVGAKRFESLPDLLDLKGYDGYEEIVFDLQADAEKMAIVTGKIINRKSGKPLDAGVAANVKVEGVTSVTAGVDSLTHDYELRFPLRERYTLSAVVTGYYPVYEVIDVTKETNEVQITRDLEVVPFERGQSILLKNVSFEAGKTITLSPASHAELDRLVTFLLENPDVKIEIAAHTDPSTKISTVNQAKAVSQYIISKGIAKTHVTARGYGTAKPVASNKTPEGKAQNRRIEFIILDK